MRLSVSSTSSGWKREWNLPERSQPIFAVFWAVKLVCGQAYLLHASLLVRLQNGLIRGIGAARKPSSKALRLRTHGSQIPDKKLLAAASPAHPNSGHSACVSQTPLSLSPWPRYPKEIESLSHPRLIHVFL